MSCTLHSFFNSILNRDTFESDNVSHLTHAFSMSTCVLFCIPLLFFFPYQCNSMSLTPPPLLKESENLRSGSNGVWCLAGPKPSNLAVSPLENRLLRCKIPKFSACGGLLEVKFSFWARRRRENFEKHTSPSDFPMWKRASLQCKIPKNSPVAGY